VYVPPAKRFTLQGQIKNPDPWCGSRTSPSIRPSRAPRNDERGSNRGHQRPPHGEREDERREPRHAGPILPDDVVTIRQRIF